METWLLFAIASIFLAGIYSFMVKVASEKHYDPSMVTGYGYLSGAVFSGIYLVYEGIIFQDFWFILALAFVNTLFYFLSTLTRMESMKNIDSVIFFPIFKTVGPILVTLLGLFLFQESLSTKEMVGIVIGILVPLMLISAHENKRQKDMKKGITFLIMTAVLTMVSVVAIKYINILDVNISMFVFLTMILGYFISVVSHHSLKKRHKHKKYTTKNIVWFGVFLGLFNWSSFYAFTRSLEGNTAIAFTINSFAILIPIILSIIYYKDHFNLKKAFVIALSIVSIILFV